MKKIICLVIAFFLVSCGENSNSSSGNGDSSSNNSSVSCTTGHYECKTRRDGTETSSYCEDGSHYNIKECYYGCNEETGRCYGDESENNSSAECTTQGAFRCNGSMVQKCDQETWKNYMECTSDQTCNAGTGKCDPKSSPTEPTEPTNPDNGAKEACTDIYECYSQCQDNTCAQACLDNGDPAGQEVFMTMYNCWMNNCQNASTNEEFTECVVANCNAETEACGLSVNGAQGDESYANPYGTAQINISSTYIVTDADSQLDQSMVTMGSFISGNFGSSQIANPAAAQSYYYTSMFTDQGETVMQTIQYFTDSTGQNILNPMAIAITNVTASVGSNYFGLLDQNAVGYVMLADVTVSGNSLNLSCYHAFSEGELTIQNLSAAAGSAGALAVNGTVNLYSPKNYANGYGDISGQLGVDVCPAQ